MDKNKDMSTYVAIGKTNKWIILDGYRCKSQSKDHFLRHMSYRFGGYYTLYDLNNAVRHNELIIKELKETKHPVEYVKPYMLVDEYFTAFGYTLVFLDGDITTQMDFSTENEAREWLESQK